jgi:CheY-like chemotaxis protein
MENLHKHTSLEIHKAPVTLAFTDEQILHLKRYGRERRTLKTPSILIVEDQDFSRKLLEGMLRRDYSCYCASNAEQAVALYAEHLPCIVLLDIELPDVSGHDLAAFFKRQDSDSFIVMVTANHYESDVKRARENNVQGYISKPYSKQKILESIEKYTHIRQLKS